MKPNINLANQALIPRESPLNLLNLAYAMAGLGLALALITIFVRHQTTLREQDGAALHAQLEAMRSTVDALGKQLAPKSVDPTLSAQLTALNIEHGELRQIEALLNGGIAGNLKGYSQQLDGLARNRVEGVWLTALNLSDQQADFTGRTMSAENIPQFIKSLDQIEAFRGRSFSNLEIKLVGEDKANSGEAAREKMLEFKIAPAAESKP